MCPPLRAPLAFAAGAVLALLLTVTPPPASAETARPVPIAVAAFDFKDTSGEPRNQTAEHAARLDAFSRTIRNDLAASGRYRIVELDCGGEPCSAAAHATTLTDKAKSAGARLLIYGGIQKMSTLIQYAKVEVVDLDAEKVVFDRLITFRGDTDEAWRRVEGFVAKEFLEAHAAR